MADLEFKWITAGVKGSRVRGSLGSQTRVLGFQSPVVSGLLNPEALIFGLVDV